MQIDFSKNKIWCKSRIVWLESKLTDWGLVVHLWGRLEVGRVEELVCRVFLPLACHGAVILLVRLHGGAYVSPGNLPRMKDTIKLQKNNFLCFKFFSCFGFLGIPLPMMGEGSTPEYKAGKKRLLATRFLIFRGPNLWTNIKWEI